MACPPLKYGIHGKFEIVFILPQDPYVGSDLEELYE